ncbi:MAG: formate/nitrite transporter family protein [Betaproteobacteria bacterium]
MADAGAESPHLKAAEQVQAAQHSAPPALVIHEVVREDGEQELKKRPSAVAWSGLAAGMSMGFSFLCLAMITSMLPETPWRHLIASIGYTVGFVITILGRQELFTETTLTVMLPLLMRRDRKTLLAVLRFWVIVLAANLAGTTLFALLLMKDGLFDASVRSALIGIAREAVSGEFGITMLKAVLSGWLIALMAWLLPSARSARIFAIMLLTYVVALCGLPHIVAGSVEAAFAFMTGSADLRDCLIGFLLPTLIGNTIGGVALVALLNHAPLSVELKADATPPGTRTRGRRAPTSGTAADR